MHKQAVTKLFRNLLSSVIHLYPQKNTVGGLHIYATKEKDFSIPVILTEAEAEVWLKSLKPEICQWVRNSRDDRLAMMSGSMAKLTNGENEQNFQFQFYLNVTSIRVFYWNARRVCRKLDLEDVMGNFLEAWTVAYFCHEFRHLIQALLLNLPDLFLDLDDMPNLENGVLAESKLKEYWKSSMDYNLGLYEKHYAGNPHEEARLLVEKDAMIIELLALDCWLNPVLSYEEKIKKLQEILRLEKR